MHGRDIPPHTPPRKPGRKLDGLPEAHRAQGSDPGFWQGIIGPQFDLRQGPRQQQPECAFCCTLTDPVLPSSCKVHKLSPRNLICFSSICLEEHPWDISVSDPAYLSALCDGGAGSFTQSNTMVDITARSLVRWVEFVASQEGLWRKKKRNIFFLHPKAAI